MERRFHRGFTAAEKTELWDRWKRGESLKAIRTRNGGYDRYRATLADVNAWARSRRPKCCKLATNPGLRQAVAGKLRLDSSPEQIAGWLKRMHPEAPASARALRRALQGRRQVPTAAGAPHRFRTDDAWKTAWP